MVSMRQILYAATLLAAFAPLTLLAQDLRLPVIGGTVYSGAGANPDAIKQVVDDFRAAVGNRVNPPGPDGDPAGRREINWDGVPDAVASPNPFPAGFFNKNSARGVVFSGPPKGWTGFQVSAKAGVAPVRFDTILQGYSDIFQAFSAERLFTSTGTHEYDVDFFVPGTEERATVSGFGAVFANVALATVSSLEFFTADGVSLGQFYARAAPKGLSFAGVTFPGRIVAKVRVRPGTSAVGEADDPANGVNVAVVDDFIYGEPVKR
jgi:hypothetical protein